MVLNAFLSLNHYGSWRHPDGDPERHKFSFYKKVARIAERGKMDMFFVADKLAVFDNEALRTHSSYIRMEPISLLSALAAVTENIGLAGTLSTTYNEPYHAARKFATLDHLSGGRAAWNVVTSTNDEEARNFGRDSHLDHERRYERAREFLEVAKGLWDSWEDDAFVLDKESGVFADQRKLHVLNHVGPNLTVRGPLNAPRPPQGYPFIVFAGSSDACQELAAESGDAVFVSPESQEQARELYGSFKGRMAKYGRTPDQLRILPGVLAIVGRTEEEAREKSRLLDSLIPDALAPQGQRNKAYLWEIVGTPEQVADELQARFENGMADGFNITSPYLPGGLEEFVDHVIPVLQRRGLFRTEYEGTTLRDRLGLERPANRHTVQV
jgi:FMN-dependent oxidoreductase (nitrilotriacetate monooxygenase family)